MPSVVDTLPSVDPGVFGLKPTLQATSNDPDVIHPTPEERTQISELVTTGYQSSNLSIFGFNTRDIAQYLFTGEASVEPNNLQLAQAEALQRATLGMEQTQATSLAGFLIDPERLRPGAGSYNLGWGDIPWGLKHLSEHPKGSHYRGTFNIGTFIDSIVGVISFGTAPSLDSFFGKLGEGQFNIGKIQLNVPFSGAHGNKYAHDVENFYGMQQINKTTTPIIDSKIGILLETIGAAIAGVIVGSKLPGAFGEKPIPLSGGPGPATGTSLESGQLTRTQIATNIGIRGVTTTIQGVSFGGIGQSVLQIFGQKIGGSLLALFSGDIGGAIKNLTTNPSNPGTGTLLYGPSNRPLDSGGGGGGGGYLPSQNTGQAGLTSVIIPLLGLSLIGLTLWYFLRKKA